MGACHGALAGKGGFIVCRFRGYDPATDHHNMTRQDRGRRIELSEPAKSLLLAKPSGAIEHKGGAETTQRISRLSTASKLDCSWSAGHENSRTELEGDRVLPKQVRLKQGDVQKNGCPSLLRRWAG